MLLFSCSGRNPDGLDSKYTDVYFSFIIQFMFDNFFGENNMINI